jgi:molybdopterin-guanine dinucleotide biosynthesis protein B
VAPTRLISIIGRKNAGKTTLVVALAQELERRKRSVATIKHGHHPALADTEGKDTWRHYHEGRAAKVLIEAPGQRVLFERTAEEADPVTLARRYMADVAIVLVEGFSTAPLPKIEVFRSSEHKAPLYSPDRADAERWIAIVTDATNLRVPVPVIRFADTSWLSTLAALAWDRALPLTP